MCLCVGVWEAGRESEPPKPPELELRAVVSSCRCWELKPCLPLEQHVLVTTEPPLYFLGDRISCSSGWSPLHHVARNSLDLSTFLSPTVECWYYRHVIPHLVHAEPVIQPRASCMQGKHSSNWAPPVSQFLYSYILVLGIGSRDSCPLSMGSDFQPQTEHVTCYTSLQVLLL